MLGTRLPVALGYQISRVVQRAAGDICRLGCPRYDYVNRGATVTTEVAGNSVTAHGIVIHEYLGRLLNFYLSERHRNERYERCASLPLTILTMADVEPQRCPR